MKKVGETAQSIELQAASHYGLGSQALYHALFSILPPDHRALLWVNSVVGVQTIPLAATLAARLLGDRRVGAIFALLIACVPLFIKNDNSDANNVPCLWWLFAGLLLWVEFLDEGRRDALAAGVALLTLAAVARPEMPVVVPLLVVGTSVAAAPRRALASLRNPWVLALGVVAAVLVLPHAEHVFLSTEVLAERDSLPGWGTRGRLLYLLRVLVVKDTVLTPSLFPVTLLGFAVYALLVREPTALRARLAVAALSVFTLAIYGLDLCTANMARVHVPGAMLLTMLAAVGIVRARDALRGPVGVILLVVVVALAALPSARRLWAPTNEQAEEDFLQRALRKLPADEVFTFVRVAREDRKRASPWSDFTHHHFPDYLLRPPVREGRVSSVTDWIDQPDWTSPAYFYAGTRCYAEFRPEGTPPPHGDNLQPGCALMRERFNLEPLVEEDVPNRGDVWLEYYGDAPTLKLGLYRVRQR